MNGLLMICKDPDCSCEDICCQECEKENCEKQCENYQYKKRIYSDIGFLVDELTELANQIDSWLVAVAAEIIQKYMLSKEEAAALLCALGRNPKRCENCLHKPNCREGSEKSIIAKIKEFVEGGQADV